MADFRIFAQACHAAYMPRFMMSLMTEATQYPFGTGRGGGLEKETIAS